MEEIYYKITNESEIHNGYEYRDGLNILKEEFNNDPNASCVKGGFYFTDFNNICKFYHYGINIRIIKLPITDPDFKITKDISGDKWRSNKIILCEKYSLLDPSTYQKLELPMRIDIIDYISSKGYINLLNL